MSLLDNIIAYISPSAAAKREAWRQALELQRHYDAGDSRRLNSGWIATNQSAEYTDRYSRDTVRARARDLERNSDLMNSVIGPFVRNVVGKGFILQADTGDEKLNQDIEALWKVWTKRRNCDVTGTQSLNQLLRMAVRRKRVDGGILFVKRYTTGGVLPFKLQLFEVDELDDGRTVPKHKNDRVVGGIEYNQYSAPVGYWIRQYTTDGMQMMDPEYIPADQAIFYFSKRRPSQLREMSDMAHTITRIRDANEFISAVAVKQRVEACLSVFIKKTNPTGIGRAAGSGPRESYDGKMLTPGMIKELNVGDDVVTINPQGQATDASSFVKMMQHMIGAGQGISYEATARDMSESTYSSARQGLIEDSMTYAEEDELIQDLLSEIYETFIISAVLAGKLKARGFWNDKDRYFRHTFTKPPKDWIDPTKESQAMQVALQTGQKTFKQVAAMNGQDWRKQIDDIADVLEYAKETHDIDLGGVIFGQKISAGQSGEPEQNPAGGQAVPGQQPGQEPQPGPGQDSGQSEPGGDDETGES